MCKMNLLKEFQTYVKKEALFEPKHKLLLALSGGLDSMVLLHILKQLHYHVSCAHVNFQLRGEASTQDAAFVKDYCLSHHIPYFEKAFETKKYALAAGLGTQEAARNLRYHWFDELVQANNYDYVLTAHHANDQAETILFHLIRGAGAKGLAGILPKNKQLVRPLLFASKQDLANYAQENSITFRNDASNDTDDYSRNYIRHQIIPKVQHIQPSFIGTMQHSAKLMQATAHYFQEQMASIQKSISLSRENITYIEAEKLLSLPFSEIVLYELINSYGFNFSQCQQAIQAYTNENIGALFLSKNNRLLIDRNQFIIGIETPPIPNILVTQFPFSFLIGDTEYQLEKSNFTGFQEKVWWLDLSLLSLPLNIRAIKEGDRFNPLGLKHSQKISDYFINKKINRFKKEQAWVLCCQEEICFLAPFQISETFKIQNQANELLKISIKKEGQLN